MALSQGRKEGQTSEMEIHRFRSQSFADVFAYSFSENINWWLSVVVVSESHA